MSTFPSFPKIDAHIHYNQNRTVLLEQAVEDNFSYLTINTDIPFFPSIDEQQSVARNKQLEYPDHIRRIATFPAEDFGSETWQKETLERLKQSLAEGAVGVKFWKNIGMDLRDQNGRMVMIDNERFDPIFDYLAKNDIPVIGHLGEPKNCWLPVDQMTVESDKDYFKKHPEYHMCRHPEFPSYEDQINARDRMLEKHPKLRFIGAHLASLEWDVDEVAKRLERFPKLAVDLAERICHLQYQAMTERNKVVDFIERYQDRIIYGTDVIDDGSMSDSELKDHIHNLWMAHWNFFTTGSEQTAPEFPGTFKGLNLPPAIVEKIYYHNAVNWYRL